MKKIAFWYVVLHCSAWGIEIKPASLTISPNSISKISAAIDTIMLINSGTGTVSIDTVLIAFLNGDSIDFRRGVNCIDYSCLNYSGWSYGASSHQYMRYLRDSLYLLQDQTGNAVRYTLQPHDSINFIVYSAINCPVCGRMPSFPKTTRFRFYFISGNGNRDSFFLNLENPTPAMFNDKKKNIQPAARITSYVNLRGQSINTRHSAQITSFKGEKLLSVKNCADVPGR